MAYAASALARFSGTMAEALIQQARCALRYLKGTKGHKLSVLPVACPIAAGSAGTAALHTGDDWANCTETRWSVSGHVITFYVTAVLWGSKKQPVVAKLACAAEHTGASMATDDALMAIKLLT
jgi:hypothetical protein